MFNHYLVFSELSISFPFGLPDETTDGWNIINALDQRPLIIFQPRVALSDSKELKQVTPVLLEIGDPNWFIIDTSKPNQSLQQFIAAMLGDLKGFSVLPYMYKNNRAHQAGFK